MSTHETDRPADDDVPGTVDVQRDPADPDVPDPEQEPGQEPSQPQVAWWHRDHPVFAALAGFFTGLVFVIVVPGLFIGTTTALLGQERAEQLFPFVLLTLVVPVALMVPRHSRRFGRYMLLGVVSTGVVVAVVASTVLWWLITRS